jgi:hypothetical protein
LKNQDITHDVLKPTFLARAPNWNPNAVGGVLQWYHSVDSLCLLVTECMKNILKEKVMLELSVTLLPNAIKYSCSRVVGAKSGHTSCARSGNSQDLAMTKTDLVF